MKRKDESGENKGWKDEKCNNIDKVKRKDDSDENKGWKNEN